jgi:iron complex outermembrane receptor protein
MSKSKFGAGASLAAILTAGLGVVAATDAAAQDAPAPATTTSEDVVITGTYLRGTPEDAALPVDVIGSKELEKRGSPTITQLVRTIPSTGGFQSGEANRFAGAGGTGGSNINLRGLGPSRTLVLFNGRRLGNSVQGGTAGTLGVDLNLLPVSAIGRVEVLKDGAAATYGSDAIGGVVNFITRSKFSGFEVNVPYQFISDTDGAYQIDAAYGWVGDHSNALLTAGYQRRNPLSIFDRDWAILQGYEGNLQNAFGGWAATGNPGLYMTTPSASALAGSPNTGFTAATTSSFSYAMPDIGCAVNGGAPFAVVSAATSSTQCQFQYTVYDNLVEQNDRYQVYGELNTDISDNLKFHGEALWARNDLPELQFSVTGPNQTPTPINASGSSSGGGTSPVNSANNTEQTAFYIPASNPGLQQYVAQVLAASCASGPLPYGTSSTDCSGGLNQAQGGAAAALVNGLIANAASWRPIGFAGNPYEPDHHSHYSNLTDTWRLEGGLEANMPWGIKGNLALTYQETEDKYNLQDISVARLQLGLRGYASRNGDANQCTAAETSNFTTNAGDASLGCYYFNPFSNAMQQSLAQVPANPFYAPGNSSGTALEQALATTADARADVVNWMDAEQYNKVTNRLFVADLVFDGELPYKMWGSDSIQWAFGGQFRYDRAIQDPDVLYSTEGTPCVDSAPYGDNSPPCPLTGVGPFLFNGNISPYDISRNIEAVFTEWKFPFTDKLEVTLADRFENYEGQGTTNNPKLAARWEPIEGFAFRTSIGTTYRAPTADLVVSSCTNGLSNATGTYRSNLICGNPNENPETATAFNFGTILKKGPFKATVDYWKFDFKDELTTEAGSDLVALFFPTTTTNHCGDATYAAVQQRFNFFGGAGPGDNCGNRDTVSAFRTNVINGGGVKTDGIDFDTSLTFDDILSGVAQVGVAGTYLLHYTQSPYQIEGFNVGGGERAGTYRASLFSNYARWRANAFINYSIGPHNFRWQTRFVSGSEEVATDPANRLAVFANLIANTASATHPNVHPTDLHIDSYLQHDFTYTVQLPWQSTGTFGVQNVFDEDPPFAQGLQYNYDPATTGPLGRIITVGLKKKF